MLTRYQFELFIIDVVENVFTKNAFILAKKKFLTKRFQEKHNSLSIKDKSLDIE